MINLNYHIKIFKTQLSKVILVREAKEKIGMSKYIF